MLSTLLTLIISPNLHFPPYVQSIASKKLLGGGWECGYGDWVSAWRENQEDRWVLYSLPAPTGRQPWNRIHLGVSVSGTPENWSRCFLNPIPVGTKAQSTAGNQLLVGGVEVLFPCTGGDLLEPWGSERVQPYFLNVCSFRTGVGKVGPADQIYPAACFYK